MLPILIPSFVIVVGIWAVGRVLNQRIPKKSEEVEAWHVEVANSNLGPTFYEKALAVVSKRSKEIALNVSTKLLYRLKIGTLKTDNFFAKMIQKMKHHRQNVETPTSEENKTVFNQPAGSILASADFEKEDLAGESKIISIKPIQEEVIFEKPEEVVAKDSFESLEQQFTNQLAYNPRDVSIYKKLGWLYLENDRHIQARQSFKTAVKLGSKDKMVMAKLLEMGGTIHKEGHLLHVTDDKAKLARKVELSSQTLHNITPAQPSVASSGLESAKVSSVVHKEPRVGRLVKIRKIRLTKTKV